MKLNKAMKNFGRGSGKDRLRSRALMLLPAAPQPLPFNTEIKLRSVSPPRSATKRRISCVQSHILSDTI
jgi:hypothetical protein